MLRWTHRLRDVLEQRDLATYWMGWACVHNLREVEFCEGASHSQLDLETLTRCMSRYPTIESLMTSVPCTILETRAIDYDRGDGDYVKFMNTRHTDGPLQDVDIIWLSDSQFLSRYCFEIESEHYAIRVEFKDDSNGPSRQPLILIAYDLEEFEDREDEVRTRRPPPTLPLTFIGNLLMSSIHKVHTIQVKFTHPEGFPPVLSVLVVVPPITLDTPDIVNVVLFPAFKKLVLALSMHQFHPNVRLSLQYGETGSDPITDQELNDVLRDCQHLHHCTVPYNLLEFESHTPSFTTSPTLTSLKFQDDPPVLFSPKMLRGLAGNKHIKHLTVELVECYHRDNEADELTKLGMHLSNHGLSRVHITNDVSKSAIQSTHAWDSNIAPALVLNWIHEQPNELSSDPRDARLVGLATRAINRGVPLGKATTVVSQDLSVSSAGAIYRLLQKLLPGSLEDAPVAPRKRPLSDCHAAPTALSHQHRRPNTTMRS
jgi:hypothetical protein